MRGFDIPHLQLSGLNEVEDSSGAWKRFVAATLMASAALLLCAVLVVILAPLLPHVAYVTRAAGMDVQPLAAQARV